MRKISTLILLICTLGAASAKAQGPADGRQDLAYAISLYENGLLSQAKTVLDGMAPSDDETVKAYSLLCSIDLKVPTYDQEYRIFKQYYLDCAQTPLIDYKYALTLYDRERYEDCIVLLESIDTRFLSKKDRENFDFFRAQSYFATDNYDVAETEFTKVISYDSALYNPQCCYALGFINYRKGNFEKALDYFTRIEKDDNFAEIATYYALECRFMLGDHAFVVKNGPAIFESSPAERKLHLARILSESFMMSGDYEKAQEYYLLLGDSMTAKSDADLYFAGSLLYSVKDYYGAAENFSKIRPQENALYQQATYNLAYSYLNLKNKIAALECYNKAAHMDYDLSIRKDALINYAKLAFDLNRDDSGFEEFASRYPKDSENDKFYSYMAVAALQNGDYNAAIVAYDKIENFDENERLNYAKANYLRACELFSSRAYSSCEPYFKAASYYAGSESELSKYSQYLLASSYFNSERYKDAADRLIGLYNTQALFPRKENDALAYDIAYCYFSMKDYAPAEKWFDIFSRSKKTDAMRKEDALVRKADCQFMLQKFNDAAKSYQDCIEAGSRSIYPHYQAGLSYGLAGNNAGKITALATVPDSLSMDRYYAPALFELGRAYETKKSVTAAVQTYERIVSNVPMSPYAPQSLLQIAMLYRSRKDDNSALKYYRRLVENYPQSEYYENALSSIESIYVARNNPKGYYDYVETLKDHVAFDKEKAVYATCRQIFDNDNFEGAYQAFTGFLEGSPSDSLSACAQYYLGRCAEKMGASEKAAGHFKNTLTSQASSDSLKILAAREYAGISYRLQNYSAAVTGYSYLRNNGSDVNVRFEGLWGMARSCYAMQDYEAAIPLWERIHVVDPESLEAIHHLAKCYLSRSQREKAKEMFSLISDKTKTPEGAEAACFLIQDTYDSGNFEAVQNMVYALADSGCNQSYYLAKAFVILGDSFMELGNKAQAKATFESVLDGYKDSEEITSAVRMRLEKLQ